MGMAASQARFLGLTARKNNVEFEGQQVNQQRTTLSNQSANYYNDLLGMAVPIPPSVDDYTKTVYTFEDGALTNQITAMIAQNDGTYKVSYLRQWVDDFSVVSAATNIVNKQDENKGPFRVGAQELRTLNTGVTITPAYYSFGDDVLVKGTTSGGITPYKYGENTYSDPPVGGLNSEAMLLQDQTITVQKDWHNELDAREASNTTLTITKDGAKYINVTMGNPTKISDHEWRQSPTTELHISCGFMTVSGDNVTVKSSGHDYTVTEPVGVSWYWDLTADVYHPMVINGDNTMLIEVTDEQMNAEGFPAEIKTLGNNKTKTSGGKKYYKFGGNLYVEQSGSNKLHAYNDRRSRLLVSKQVTGSDAPADAMFKFTVNMENTYAKYSTEVGYDRDIDGFWFVVVKDPNADLEKLIELPNAIARTTDGLVVTNATPQAGNTGYYWFDNVQGGTSATISIKAGWRIYFPNVGRGADYSIEELGGTNMPEGFVFDKVVTTAVNHQQGETSTPAAVDANNKLKVNGSFDKSNTIYSAAYTNSYKGVFYVYHSSNCSVERFPMAVNGVARSTFNIFERTVIGTLYGGYFDDYAGKSASFNAKTLTYTGSPVPTATDAGGTAYSCAYIKTCDRAAWNSATAYTQSGKNMTPVKDTVYYLKEVPTAYLQPYTHYTYKKGDKSLQNMWYISANDDLRYNEAGFFVETFDAKGKKTATIVTTLTVTNSNGGATVTLSPKSVFGKRTDVQAGYLTYWDAKNSMREDQTSVFTPFWYTPDNIYVCGITTRTINFNKVKVGSGSDCMRITDADNATPFPNLAE